MLKKIKKNFFTLGVIFIILASIILRFYDYNDRWGLAYDQAHDSLVARYAVQNAQLPLLGPFSSAGPFQTGGEWYWIIMLPTAIFPSFIMAPWIFMTSLYVLFVLGIILLAKELINKPFALIVGALAAVSSAQITQGTNLTNQSPQAVLSLLSIWAAIRFLRTKQKRYLFFLALTISTAASVHLQGAAMSMLLFFTFIFSGIPRISSFLVVAAGLFIPWIPVFITDIQRDFFNTRNMIQYYTHDQYRISLDSLGRRWLTYAGVFWPKMWGYIIGGNHIVGLLIGTSVVLVSGYKLWKRTLSKEWIVLLLSFFGMVGILRYTRTPLFESYTVFLHPFIFLFTGWIVYLAYKKNKIIGMIILLLIVAFSLQKSFDEIQKATNNTAIFSREMREKLVKKYPETKFTIYEYRGEGRLINTQVYSVAMFLDEHGLNDDKGKKIGFKQEKEIIMVDLEKKSDAELEKEKWHLVTPKDVYLSTEEWYKRK